MLQWHFVRTNSPYGPSIKDSALATPKTVSIVWTRPQPSHASTWHMVARAMDKSHTHACTGHVPRQTLLEPCCAHKFRPHQYQLAMYCSLMLPCRSVYLLVMRCDGTTSSGTWSENMVSRSTMKTNWNLFIVNSSLSYTHTVYDMKWWFNVKSTLDMSEGNSFLTLICWFPWTFPWPVSYCMWKDSLALVPCHCGTVS